MSIEVQFGIVTNCEFNKTFKHVLVNIRFILSKNRRKNLYQYGIVYRTFANDMFYAWICPRKLKAKKFQIIYIIVKSDAIHIDLQYCKIGRDSRVNGGIVRYAPKRCSRSARYLLKNNVVVSVCTTIIKIHSYV